MARVFEGTVWVDYSQVYVISDENAISRLGEAFCRQSNGLCGAAVTGALYLKTGLRFGRVGFTVDVLDAPPPLDATWEEIVEASFFVADTAIKPGLMEWAGQAFYPIPLPLGSYRVRYCARGMQIAHDPHETPDDGDVIDSYSLAFWPAEVAEDRIIKQTTEIAAYCHKEGPEMSNRIAAAPPPLPTPPSRATAPGMDQEQMQIFNAPAPKSTPEEELYAVTLFPLPPRPALRSTLPETEAILPMTANLRPTILFRQKPRYTDEARNEGVEGTVILEVTFHVNGTITGIRVVRGLPHGLTECAIEVAQEIRFNPAVKNGAPVSVRGTLEYTFKL